ncbi:YadA-like family protein [Providencia stuartii]|uniref:YadA C-terminal domain-containing protein n=1 Tax=Providencia stuartii TaxID=588 RepID=UPI0018C57253|nr:YadA C-terminal domain-containing protein [Providencia stuartii]MBG5909611.1 YadA-like family protein [Providencia stuartii]
MKLTKISAVIITTLGLSSAAFASEIPHPPIYNPDSIINELPTGEAPTSPPILMPDGSTVGGKFTYSAEDSYEAAHVLGKQVDKNTATINDINGRLDGTSQQVDKNTATINDINGRLDGTSQQVDKNTAAINDINGRLDGTSQQLEGAISRGETELAQIKEDVATNTGAIKDTSERLESSLEEQKKVNVLVGNALASNENYWQQQWATNENYAASINQNTSAIAQNRQDINKLNSRVDRLDQKVDDLNDTMKRGFASQAALNGLFQPYGVGKLNATMALGGYESKTAIAAGTGYRFDENTAVKAGIATNTDDFKGVTYNVGVNFEW